MDMPTKPAINVVSIILFVGHGVAFVRVLGGVGSQELDLQGRNSAQCAPVYQGAQKQL